MHAPDIEYQKKARKTIFMGLGMALAWLLIVGGISYYWAVSTFPEESHATGAPAAAGH